MIHIFRPQASTSARDLAALLNTDMRAKRWQQPANLQRAARRGDTVVYWGASPIPNLPAGVRSLNGVALQNKMRDVATLTAAGVPTITISTTRPEARNATVIDPALAAWNTLSEATAAFSDDIPFSRSEMSQRALGELLGAATALQGAFSRPVPPARPVEEWVGRVADHIGGLDLLTPPARPDFWVRKETIVREFRVHSFLGHSIRSGIKRQRDGFRNPSPWVRSWDGGWVISYDGESIQQRHRDIAHQAVTALGLQFGAVDLGELADGSLIVLECNRAPGIEGGTLEAYKNAIAHFAEGSGR